MVKSNKFLEKILQNCRFRMAKPYLNGDVLDFGGNRGELKRLVKGKYLLVNYDHSAMKNTSFDTIVCLAVIEHIEVGKVFDLFQKFHRILNDKGIVVITTPAKIAEPFLIILSLIGILDRENIKEHKHYWNKKEIHNLARKSGLKVKKYQRFQIGFNQLAIFGHS